MAVVLDKLLYESGNRLLAENGTDLLATESTEVTTVDTTEAPTTAEVVSRIGSFKRTTVDAPTTAESATAVRTPRSITGTATDALTTAEAVTASRAGRSITGTATDAISTSEAATGTRAGRSITGTATDAVTTAEAITRIGSFIRTTTDASTTAENATATKFAFLVRSTADAPTTSDAANRVGSFHPATIEAISTGEVIAKAASHPRSTTDAVTTAEAATGVKLGGGALSRTTTEALSTAESAGRSAMSFTRTAVDSLSTAEAIIRGKGVTRSTVDATSTADAVARIGSFHPKATDNPTTVELVYGTKFAFLIRSATDALTATEITPGLSDGDAVTSWPDGSGNGHNAASTTNPPILKVNILNGKPGVLFDGSTTFLRIAANAGMQSANYTMFAVVKTGSAVTGTVLTEDYGWDTGGSGDNNVRYEFGYEFSTAVSNPFFDVGHYSSTYGWTVAESPYPDSTNTGYIYSGGFDGSLISLYRAGSLVATNATTATTAGVGNWWIGRRHDNYTPAAPFFNGHVLELLVFDSGLSGTNRANIEKWLGDKYGLSVAGGTAVDPTTVTGLQLYLRADSLAGQLGAVAVVKPSVRRTCTEFLAARVALPGASDGDAVAHWPDNTSSMSLDSPGAGTTSPTFKSPVINGRAVIRCNGSSDGMVGSLANEIINTPNTVFAVFKQSAAFTGGYGFFQPVYAHGYSSSHAYGLGCDASGIPSLYDATTVMSGSVSIQGAFHIISGIQNGASSGIFVDGTSVASGTLTNNGVGQLELGVMPLYGIAWLGDVAEIIIYSGGLSSTDRANIEKGLADYYGLSVAGGTAVDPSSVSGLLAWFRADSLAGLPGVDVVIKTPVIRSATDALTTAEAVTATRGVASVTRTATDALTTSESATGIRTALTPTRTATDALTTSEAIARILSRHVTTTDAPVTAEVATKAASHPRTATDALVTAEAVTATRGAQSLTRTATEALATSELATGVRSTASVTRTTSESLTTAESIVKSATHPRTTTDALVTSESATGVRSAVSVTRTATDALVISESATAARTPLSVTRTAVDALATAEVIVKSATHTRTATDAPTTGEVASKTATHTRTTSDALGIIETLTAIRTGAGVFARSTAEAPTTSETVTWKLTALRTAADAPHTAELATGVRLGLSITRTATDALATAETSTGARTPRSQGRTAIDALTTANAATASKFGVVIRNATDALTANLVANRILVAGRTTGEALTVAEAANRRWVGTRVATDMLTAVDYTEAGGTAFLFIAGQVAGSTPYVTSAGSSIRISSTNSTLDAIVAGSNVKASRTGSGLKVEKTK